MLGEEAAFGRGVFRGPAGCGAEDWGALGAGDSDGVRRGRAAVEGVAAELAE